MTVSEIININYLEHEPLNHLKNDVKKLVMFVFKYNNNKLTKLIASNVFSETP